MYVHRRYVSPTCAKNLVAKMECSILLEFKGSKRQIKYENTSQDDIIKLCEEEMRVIARDKNVRLVIDLKDYHKAEGEKPYLLQRFSTEWDMFVDVIDVIEIDDRDHLKAVPLPAASPVKVHAYA